MTNEKPNPEQHPKLTPEDFANWSVDARLNWLAAMLVELCHNQKRITQGLGQLDAALGTHHQLLKRLINGPDPESPAPRPN